MPEETSDTPIATPVWFSRDEDAFIYDANNEIVADLDSLSDGLGSDDSHPGTKEFNDSRNEVGEHIAKCVNEHADLETRLTIAKQRLATIEFMAKDHEEPGGYCVLCAIDGYASGKLEPIRGIDRALDREEG